MDPVSVGLSKCQYQDVAGRDVRNALSKYPDLKATIDTFVFNDGANKQLMALDGTIPVSYKGSIYNIPIVLWLLESHPYNAPMVFVKPTSSMQIKPGRYVDSNGKVSLPYLRDWRHPNSDLYALLQLLAITFGEEPPVFARNAAPPRPPYPPGGQQPYPMAAGQAPYPAAGGSLSMPMLGGPVNPPGYQQMPYPSSTTSYPPQQSTPYPASSYTPNPYPTPPAYNAAQSSYPGATGYPSYPQASTAATGNYPGYQGATTTASTQSSAQANALSDEQIRSSLYSAVQDKMRRKLKEVFAQAAAETEALKRTQEDLNKGREKLDQMLKKLEEEQTAVDDSILVLNDKHDELKQIVNKIESQKDVNVDDAVDTTTPLYRQLVNCFAEEQATEDAIYYLGEALRKSVIDIDVFLKQVRELSRKQFTQRALINKCRQKAGLPEVVGH